MNKEEIFRVFYDKEKWEVYNRFKEIENNIDKSNELYEYYDDIKSMLLNEKTYIKVRGFRIICKLSKWDKDNKINKDIDLLLSVLDDDKPTNVRQCLAVLNDLILNKKELLNRIEEKIKKIDYTKYKDTMSPLIKKDIDYILNRM